jgi:hypothetical protein
MACQAPPPGRIVPLMSYATRAADYSDSTEADNRLVWTGAAPHYEVWYCTFNHRATRTGFWIRYTLEAPTHAPAYAQLWFAVFHADAPEKNFGINRRFPIAALNATPHPFRVAIADAELRHDGMKGALDGDGHQVRWDLSWLPATSTHRHLPGIIYDTPFADTRVLSPNLDVPLRGTVSVDGVEHVLEGDPGGQTHVWGRKHAHAWAWAHCNAFSGHRGAAFEALTAQLKKRGRVLPPLTVAGLYLDGERLGFTDLADTLWNRGRMSTGYYQFRAQGLRARIEGEYRCRPEDMILTEYADPDGEPSFCANTAAGSGAGRRTPSWWRTAPRTSRSPGASPTSP